MATEHHAQEIGFDPLSIYPLNKIHPKLIDLSIQVIEIS